MLDKMGILTKWFHNTGVKDMKRTKLKITKKCTICGKELPILSPSQTKYCKICAKKVKKEQIHKSNQKRIESRDKIKHSAYNRELYHINRLKELQIDPITEEPFVALKRNKYASNESAEESKRQKMVEINKKAREKRNKIDHAVYNREWYHRDRLLDVLVDPISQVPFIALWGKIKYATDESAKKAKRQQMVLIHQKERENRIPIVHAAYMRFLYNLGFLRRSKSARGTMTLRVTPIEEDDKGILKYDWKYYHEILKEVMKPLKLKTKQDYNKKNQQQGGRG
jgi:hypothetical protein